MSRPLRIELVAAIPLVAALTWALCRLPEDATPKPPAVSASAPPLAPAPSRTAEPDNRPAPESVVPSTPAAPRNAIASSARSGSPEDSGLRGRPVEGPLSAEITTSGGVIRSAPDALGRFPRVNIAPEEEVRVSVAYAEAQPGDLVVVQAEDGGVLEGSRTALPLKLDADRRLRFAFKSTREGGIYRVTLRRGFEERRLEFWGGKEPVVVGN